jgi:hypothetical protein
MVKIDMEYASIEELNEKSFDEFITKINEQYEAGDLSAYQ